MRWGLYKWTFRLKSPLYIGYHKVFHFYRTRYYVPAKIIWASITAKLADLCGISDYGKIGEFLKKAMRFSYLYLLADNQLYLPSYTKEGIKLGRILQHDFEKKFISSQAFSSIDPYSFTAEEGMLHEVEFINPYTINEGKPVFLKGLVWIRNYANDILTICSEKDALKIKSPNRNIDFRDQVIRYLQIGGERKYGFGLIEIEEFEKISEKKDLESEGFHGNWQVRNDDILIELSQNKPVWAHIKNSNSLQIKGDIELLIEREWDSEKGAGRNIRSHGICWVPGSIVVGNNTKFKVTEFGIWELTC